MPPKPVLIRPLLALSLSLVLGISARAATDSATDSAAVPTDARAQLWIDRGDSLRTARDFDAALDAYGRAREIFAARGDDAGVRRIALERLAVLLRSGDARACLDDANRLIDVAEDAADSTTLARALYWKARAYDSLGRDRRAIPTWRSVVDVSSAVGDSMRWAMAESYLGRWARHDGDLDAAADHIARSNAIFLRIGADRSRAINLIMEGLIAIGRDRPEEARAFWQEGLRASRDFTNPSIFINCINNIAVLEATSGDPSVALECWQEARRVALERKRWRESVRPTLNLAGLLSSLGRREEAIDLLGQARELSSRHGYTDLEAEVTLQLATTAQRHEAFAKSVELYRRAYEVLEERGNADDRFMARRGLALSLIELDSTAAARRALEDILPEREKLSPRHDLALDVARATIANAEGRAAEALQITADARRRAGPEREQQTRLMLLEQQADAHRALARPDSVLATLETARRLYERFRVVPTDATWREQRSDYAYRVYPRLAYDLLRHRGTDTPTLHALLQAYKARTLLERITEPGQEVTTTDDVVVALSVLQSDVLGDDELFVDLYAGEEHSLLFAITHDHHDVFVLPGVEDLAERLRDYVELVRNPAAPRDDRVFLERASRHLFEELFAAAHAFAPQARRWVVSLDGPFTPLPMAALLAEIDEGLQIVRVPSAQVFAQLRLRPDPPVSASGILALLPRGAADGLPGSVAEVDALRARFDDVEIRTLGQTSDILATASAAPPAVLHVASHARLVESDPWRSAILFDAIPADAAPARRPLGDRPAQLRALDIVDLQIATPLVVLSGCETLGGELFAGAGVLGLSSAFLVAGAREVLATLWPVDDHSTGAFMAAFYESLGDGRTPAGALAVARQRLRNDPSTAHPFHWAGFVLVGDDSVSPTLRARAGDSTGRWVLAALFAAALIALVSRRVNSR